MLIKIIILFRYIFIIVVKVFLVFLVIIHYYAPGLADWWDKMSVLIGMIALVTEYYTYGKKYGGDDD